MHEKLRVAHSGGATRGRLRRPRPRRCRRSLRVDGEGRSWRAPAARDAGPGELSKSGALATSADGRVFVFDRGNKRVLVFSPTLAYEREWPLSIDSDRLGQMIAIGPPGAERVYIAQCQSRAQCSASPSTGALEWNVGQRGDYPGEIRPGRWR